MVKIVWYLLYLLAGLGAGCQASLYGGDLIGLGAGLLTFLICLQIQNAIVHARTRKRTEEELLGLRRAAMELETALSTTRTRMEAMEKAIDDKTSAQNRKIVGELRLLESLMREQTGLDAPSGAVRTTLRRNDGDLNHGRFMARVFEGQSERDTLETIRISLEENRVDLLLQPIVGLPQRKLRYYEAYSRLRTVDGRVIMPKQFIDLAAPAGLMSVIDNLFLFRCVQIVRRLARKHRDVAVFCNLAGETLADGEFFPQFLEYIEQNRDLKHHIVFEFSQAAILSADKEIEMRLKALSKLGFALSMDRVETLALDFARLRDLGIRYLKLKATALIGDMRALRAPVAGEDLKVFLRRNHIQLIVEYVESEKTVVQLLDYAVDFAQGHLFGEPRTVREEALRPTAAPLHTQTPARIIPLKRAG